MKGDRLPDGDHVARLCGGSHICEDGTNAPTAFKPRAGEAYMSVNWLEVLGLPPGESQIDDIFRVLDMKRKLGASARLAILNVGDVHELADPLSRVPDRLVVRHEPEFGTWSDPSHSGIYGVPVDDNVLPELLARAVLRTCARS